MYKTVFYKVVFDVLIRETFFSINHFSKITSLKISMKVQTVEALEVLWDEKTDQREVRC
jgi:hypothetical protein